MLIRNVWVGSSEQGAIGKSVELLGDGPATIVLTHDSCNVTDRFCFLPR